VTNRLPLPETIEVQDATGDGRHTLVLSGELDIASSAELKARLLQLCANQTTAITLDLSRLTFMDSTGLFMVLFAKELADTHGYDFSLVPGSPTIQHVFELTGLLDALPFRADGIKAVPPCAPTATEQDS
jgi:anti-sigma B factor antagonist